MPMMKTNKKPFWTKKRRDLLFYIVLIAPPVAQFCIFYIGVNLNSILLAFQSYDESLHATWVGFRNILAAFQELTSNEDLTWIIATRNSLIAYATGLVVGVPLSLLFSYYIYKKMLLHRTFKILLFLPSILTSMVMVLVFQFFANEAIPRMFNLGEGLLSTSATAFATVLAYSLFTGFGTSVLLYSGAMSGISKEQVESCKLDGATWFQEFRHITFPSIYPTIVTFLVVGVAGIFTNQLNLYSFFGETVQLDRGVTLGHLLFSLTRYATVSTYPRLVSIGLIFTIIAVPLTWIIKNTLEKIGPKES